MKNTLHIIGAGLAGSEAAWQAAELGCRVVIHEMRGVKETPAHHTADCAELVCSNSFRSDDFTRNAVGLLHEEMRRCGSLILKMADAHKVPAGGALAVDREEFSKAVTQALETHPNITLTREEITTLPPPGEGLYIFATGPLTSPALAESLRQQTGEEYLAFFDAIAPIVAMDSINMNVAWRQSRYDKGDGADYINCPMNQAQYETFIEALRTGDKTEFKEWEKNTPYFEGCLPIEVMAERGRETLRFGPMKPVGLTNPHIPPSSLPPQAGGEGGGKPYAVVQLRQDNKLGTLYNMVGFQTKLKYGEQQRIFRTIPGLENAEFARLGGIHRNTFIKSPVLLDAELRLKSAPHIRMAGQVTGVEGYVESAACGLLAGLFSSAELLRIPSPLRGEGILLPPLTTALGALLNHITGGAHGPSFQPMNINFGLFPPLTGRVRKENRPQGYSTRALADLQTWTNSLLDSMRQAS